LTCRCRFKVWSRLTPSVVTVSERCTTEPAMLMDVMCGNAQKQFHATDATASNV